MHRQTVLGKGYSKELSIYDQAQLAAWAPQPPDLAHWRQRLKPLQTLIAENNTELLGFIAYEETGHIDLLYVAPGHIRRGIATLLFSNVERGLAHAGVRELSTEASMIARPFFERQSFHVTEEQNVSVRGSTLRRYAMHKTLTAAQQAVPRGVAASRRRP